MAPWTVILPLVAGILQSGIAGGMSANQASRENNRQAQAARLRRAELQPLIDSLKEARDYFGVEENLVRDFTRAADQMAAQSAQTGMTNAGSGGLDQVRGDMLGGLLAELAQFKTQDENQRQNLLAQILSDPMLYAGTGPDDNVGLNTLIGTIGGGAAGAGSVLNSFLSTPEGIAALGDLFTGSADAPVDVSNPGVTASVGSWTPAPAPQPARLAAQQGSWMSPVAQTPSPRLMAQQGSWLSPPTPRQPMVNTGYGPSPYQFLFR